MTLKMTWGSARPKKMGRQPKILEAVPSKNLMVRRRERALSNHEAPLSASSFETRARALLKDEG
jgi:hypothetical protein